MTCAAAPAQEPYQVSGGTPPAAIAAPALDPGDKPLPITLPTALRLAGVRPLDIAAASQQVETALAQLRGGCRC